MLALIYRTSPRAGDKDTAELQEAEHMISGLMGDAGSLDLPLSCPTVTLTIQHGASTAALPGPEAARQPQACFYSALFLLSGALVVEHLGPRLFLTVEPGTLALTESGEACRSLDAGVGAFVASWMSRLRVVLVGRLLVGRFPAAPCLDPTE